MTRIAGSVGAGSYRRAFPTRPRPFPAVRFAGFALPIGLCGVGGVPMARRRASSRRRVVSCSL